MTWSHLLSDLLTYPLRYFTLFQPNSPSCYSLNTLAAHPLQGHYTGPSLRRKHTCIFFHGQHITYVSAQTSPPAVDWIFESPQNLYVDILTPMVMLLGDGTLGSWKVHEQGLMNGMVSLWRWLEKGP